MMNKLSSVWFCYYRTDINHNLQSINYNSCNAFSVTIYVLPYTFPYGGTAAPTRKSSLHEIPELTDMWGGSFGARLRGSKVFSKTDPFDKQVATNKQWLPVKLSEGWNAVYIPLEAARQQHIEQVSKAHKAIERWCMPQVHNSPQQKLACAEYATFTKSSYLCTACKPLQTNTE